MLLTLKSLNFICKIKQKKHIGTAILFKLSHSFSSLFSCNFKPKLKLSYEILENQGW